MAELDEILEDVDAFEQRNGRWPKRDDEDPPREGATWMAYEQALRRAHGITLRGLIDRERGALNTRKRKLTLALVRRRGSEFKERHGEWPTRDSGQVEDEPEGETWLRWEGAVQQGLRGLARKPSLAHVFTGGKPDKLGNRAIRRADRPARDVDEIVSLMRSFHRRTGEWPTEATEDEILERRRGETWRRLNKWLLEEEGTTLVALARERLGARNRNRPGPLDIERLKKEIRKFRRKHGRLPTRSDGPIDGWSGEVWENVHKAMSTGKRGTDESLPGPMTLKQFAERYVGVGG